jgi:hypothetical protein
MVLRHNLNHDQLDFVFCFVGPGRNDRNTFHAVIEVWSLPVIEIRKIYLIFSVNYVRIVFLNNRNPILSAVVWIRSACSAFLKKYDIIKKDGNTISKMDDHPMTKSLINMLLRWNHFFKIFSLSKYLQTNRKFGYTNSSVYCATYSTIRDFLSWLCHRRPRYPCLSKHPTVVMNYWGTQRAK